MTFKKYCCILIIQGVDIMKEYIAAVLKSLRNSKGFSADYVVNELKKLGNSISTVTLYGYENGVSQPKADTFLQICKIYDIKDFNIFFENNLQTVVKRNHYDELNETGKMKADDYIEDLYGNPRYNQDNKNFHTPTVDFDAATDITQNVSKNNEYKN